MAKKASDSEFLELEGQIMHKWERDNGDFVLLLETTFKGQPRFDLRVWYQERGEYRPARAGISFHPTELKHLLRAVRQAGKSQESD